MRGAHLLAETCSSSITTGVSEESGNIYQIASHEPRSCSQLLGAGQLLLETHPHVLYRLGFNENFADKF